MLHSLAYYENSRVFASFRPLQAFLYMSGRAKKLDAIGLLRPAWAKWSKGCRKVKIFSTKNRKTSQNWKKCPKLGEIGSNFETFIAIADSSKVNHGIFTT